MDHGLFRGWLAQVDDLTVAQRLELEEVLAGRPPRAAVTAAIEAGADDQRCCPHCGHRKAVGCGRADGLQRFRCKGCGKSFNALTGTPLARLRKKECWLDFGQSLSEGETVVASAERCGVAVSTAFRWRHRFLTCQEATPTLTGIVEADEAFVLLSYKGSRAWERAEKGLPGADLPDREARKRGGKATKRGLSHEQVPIIVAAARGGGIISAVLEVDTGDAIKAVLEPVLSKDALLVTDGGKALARCATKMNVSHEVLNQSAASGSGANCTSRTSTAYMSGSRPSCALGAVWLPNTSPAISAGSIEPGFSMPRQPEHASMPPSDCNSGWPYRPNAN